MKKANEELNKPRPKLSPNKKRKTKSPCEEKTQKNLVKVKKPVNHLIKIASKTTISYSFQVKFRKKRERQNFQI